MGGIAGSLWRTVLTCLTLFVIGGPGDAAAQEAPIIFAASSLKNALDAVNEACADETGAAAIISYAASSALARQIEAGAPADLFISADRDWMNYLSDRKLMRPGTETELLGNRLVLIAPAASAARGTVDAGLDLAGLLGESRLAIGDVKAVPAGKYGRAALESLGLWSAVEGRLAQAENVRAALKLVAAGEAALGIVYQTDAAADPSVRIVGSFPAGSHPPIVYPAAQTAESRNGHAKALLACLMSDKAKVLFEAQGFTFITPVPTRKTD